MEAHIVSSSSHISFFKEKEEKNVCLLAQSDFTFTFLSCFFTSIFSKQLVNITFFNRDFVPVHILTYRTSQEKQENSFLFIIVILCIRL